MTEKQVETISSLTNNKVKELASLTTKKGRATRNSFPAEGVKIIEECLNCGAKIIRIAVSEELFGDSRFTPLLENVARSGASVISVSREAMKKMSGMQTPPGILAEVAKPESPSPAEIEFNGPVVLACEIRDPRNAGLLVRTAAGAGAEAVIFTNGSVDPFHPEAVQSSMGGLFHIPILWDVTAAEIIELAKKAKASVVATVATGGVSAAKWAARDEGGFLLLLGNEGAGLAPELEQAADVKVTLPMHNNVESLNVAVSAGVLLYMAGC